jgi:hypothetical protein
MHTAVKIGRLPPLPLPARQPHITFAQALLLQPNIMPASDIYTLPLNKHIDQQHPQCICLLSRVELCGYSFKHHHRCLHQTALTCHRGAVSLSTQEHCAKHLNAARADDLLVRSNHTMLQHKSDQQHAITFPTAKMQSHKAGMQRISHYAARTSTRASA